MRLPSRWGGLIGIGGLLVGCAAARAIGPAPRPPADAKVNGAAAGPIPSRELYCSTLVYEWDRPRCIHELTPEQRAARPWSIRLRIQNGVATETQSVNGRGVAIDNDQGLATLRYHYDGDRVVGWEGRNRNGAFRILSRFVGERHEVVNWLDDQERRMVLPGTRAIGAHRKLDHRGRVAESAYFDAGIRRTENERGAVVVRFRYDESGSIVEESFFAADLTKSTNGDGVHRIVYEVDEWGEWTSKSFFGTDDRPILSPQGGMHRVVCRRDAFHNCVECSNLDVNGALVLSRTDRVAVTKTQRNAHGSETRVDYFGVTGEPVTSVWGYASREQTLDDNEDTMEWRHFDVAGKLAPRNAGHAILRHVRDIRRNVTEDHYLDPLGKPVRTRDGCAQIRRKYDDRDNEIRGECFDENGSPVVTTSGYHAWNASFDGVRHERTWYEDENGRSSSSIDGFSSFTTTYDDGGAVAGHRYFDPKGAEVVPRARCPGTFERSDEKALSRQLSKLVPCIGNEKLQTLVLRVGVSDRGRFLGYEVEGEPPGAPASACLVSALSSLPLPRPLWGCASTTIEIQARSNDAVRVLKLADTEPALPPG